jgi:hypothetical protein
MWKTVGLLLAICSFASPAIGASAIEVDPKSIFLDNIWQGTPSPFSVNIKNTGDTPVELKAPQFSCSCTEVNLSKHNLKAGESAALTGKVLKNRPGKFSVTGLVRIVGSDSAGGLIQIRGETKQAYMVTAHWLEKEPAKATVLDPEDLPDIPPGKPRLHVSVIAIRPEDPIFSNEKWDGKNVKAELRNFRLVESSKHHLVDQWLLTLIFEAVDELETGDYSTTLKVTLEPGREVEQLIRYRVIGDVSPVRQQINLGRVLGGKAFQVQMDFAENVVHWSKPVVMTETKSTVAKALVIKDWKWDDRRLTVAMNIDPSKVPSSPRMPTSYFGDSFVLTDVSGKGRVKFFVYGMIP